MENQQNKFMDKIIIQQRNQQKEAIKREEERKELINNGNDITTGKAIVNDDIIIFYRMEMIQNNISLLVPEDFIELTDAIINKLYPGDYQPQYLYSSHDGSITVLFDILFSEADEESFTLVRKELLKNFRKEYNDFALHFDQIKNGQDKDIYYFIKKQQITGGVNYTITLLMIIKGFIVMGRISCVGHRIKDWKDILYQMMTTIIVEGDEEK